MCRSPFSSMKPANAYEMGRMAHLPFHTKYDTLVSATMAKISSDSQVSKVKGASGKNGYRSRMERTVGLYNDRKSVKASSATWTASAPHKVIQASQ